MTLEPPFENYHQNHHPWYPDRIYRVSGVIAEGDPSKNDVVKQTSDGTYVSFYQITGAESSVGEDWLLRFGASTTEGGYLVLPQKTLKNICLSIGPPGAKTYSSEFNPVGFLADGGAKHKYHTIDTRNEEMELQHSLGVLPVIDSHIDSLELRTMGNPTKGAAVQFTRQQTQNLDEYLKELTSINFEPKTNSPKTTLIEPSGKETIHNLQN